ncbi:MAG TPA: sigma-70 family RNA polymerase sigma factor [Thermoanaerobaculia bacterium]|nr:sigma-70 family RNA polymerase sigma factor [Thermoanaerobaculia bacterium]
MRLRDEGALSELYDRYASLVLAVARRILIAKQDAEETLQETFLQAWLQADRYDSSRSSVPTWLVLIARSRALDRLRARQARDRATTAAEAEPRPADPSGRSDLHVLHGERRNRVRSVLESLPAEQREVLELAFWEGLSQTEIATRTGAPLGTVKTRALLGMKKVRQALREEIRELI